MSEEVKPEIINDLVVVGSSAGGVGALSVLVSTLPKEFPAPVVLAQHLDPQRPSNLGSILERRSSLPIVLISDTEPTRMEKGTIYVVPANRHVMIEDGHVRLGGDHEERPLPSIDLLLTTAAKAYGEHLVAVILTGSGSDGAAGAVEVKHAGGVVIIQNPQTAQYPSMPMSLPPTVVDHITELEQIGPLLNDLVRSAKLPPTEKVEDPLRELLTLVSRQTNIDFRSYKPSTILRRITRRMAVTHNPDLHDYAQYLEMHPEEVQELVRAFLIKVTGFFRDPEAYEYLRTYILPELIERGRTRGRVLRLWSAGCATGEEPYSLALLLADLLGPELPEWSLRIFATDLDEGAVNFSRRGLYPTNVLQDLPDDYRERYFEQADQGYRIIKPLRQMVIFGHQDLSRGTPFPRIDMVVCRNLLIYLKPELQQAILDLFAYSLHQTNGYLFLGKAETARPTKATFEIVSKKWKIYRCMGGPLALPPTQDVSPTHMGVGLPYSERRARAYHLADAERQTFPPEVFEREVSQLRHFNEVMLRYLPLGVVVIDRSYRIIMLNGGARRLLGIREVANEQDFLHTVRGLPYAQVREGIDTAFRERSPVALNELELDASFGSASRYINLIIMITQTEPGAPELALLSISDATEQVQTRKRLEAVQAEQTQLVGELSTANKRFSDMNKELQDANEELQAANEELMLTQEELQATNEEFEATNEELQATNEELETNNEELQATNEELQTTNDELTARTHEMQEVGKELASERIRLSEMIGMLPLYIMMLKGPELLVENFNPRYERLFGGREIKNRSFEEIFSGAEMEQFVETVRKAYKEDQTLTTPRMLTHVPDEKGEPVESYFIHTIIPIHDSAGKVGGVFIYTENATERDTRESQSGEME
ncbi:MAG TPA: CheR family methyltransferase [Pyrinomonadaceae bacterium]|jgi:two-component system CheB/CheR fusion protein